MRSFEIVKSRASSLRLVTALLLAGAATGCSSDVTRFDGLFSSKTDQVTTNSIPHRVTTLNGQVPTPAEGVANGDSASGGSYQSYPQTAQYDSSTSTVDPVRSGGAVQRSDLSSPTSARRVERTAAIEPLTTRRPLETGREVVSDRQSGGTVRSVWKVSDNSPRVMIKSGDTLSGIAHRYGVPQAEILRANGMQSAADLKYGKSIIVPVSGKVAAQERAGHDSTELASRRDQKVPMPGKQQRQDDAILPTASASGSKRDRNKLDQTETADAGQATGNGQGGYVVKEGDSLARIARTHGVDIDQLKKANGMNTASIRVGQKLVIPTGGHAADDVKTASIPTRQDTKTASEIRPKTYTPPAEEKSVAEVQKSSDDGQDAPDATGIGKYRWPVRGAVIAGYGQNVEGTRNTGIDISVPEGTPVKAAENGVVIYSGSGLKDLGNTVLIRHDDGTVTVYGNADALNVKRGDKVNRGQVIASSGMTGGATRPKLHFEVRQNAVAVNPMTFLQ